MAIFYRVESKDKPSDLPNVNLGAYRSGVAYECASDGATDMERHPDGYHDMKLSSFWESSSDRSSFVFGFESIESLNRWFDCRKGRESAKSIGRIAIYHCPDDYFIKGSFQCLARASELSLIEVQCLTYRM